jgi:hypothetical protein
MDDFVAVVVGVANYEGLKGWNVPQDRTAKDAIAITEALRNRQLPAEQIKLFISMQAKVPAEVMGVPVTPASREQISDFLVGDFKRPPFSGKDKTLLFFCSGHGFIVGAEPCLILADSKPAVTSQATYRCLGIDQLRTQLLGMRFTRQILCVNTCQVPAEWSPPGKPSFVDTSADRRLPGIQQVRFLAAPEMQTAPVESRGDGLSNGFAAAVRACIDKYDWPPNPVDWDVALRGEWGDLVTSGLHGVGQSKFKILRDGIRKIDRTKQLKLASKSLEFARNWATNQKNATEPDVVLSTLLDLHAVTSDELTILVGRLDEELIKPNGDIVSGGLGYAKWPEAGLTAAERKRVLFQSLAEQLVDNETLDSAEKIVAALADLGGCVRIVFIEIKGPCSDSDRALILEMISFWKDIIARLMALKTRVSTVPLLIVGHVNPDPAAGAAILDTASYYHAAVPPPGDKRRLSEIQWDELVAWLDEVLPKSRHPGRSDLDAVIAQELGAELMQRVQPVRMAKIVNVVTRRAGPAPQI